LQFKALASIIAYSTAFLFKTGLEPGMPKQTSQTKEFGSASETGQWQKSFDKVESCTWTSRPILTN
jgi:hypothetical protein